MSQYRILLPFLVLQKVPHDKDVGEGIGEHGREGVELQGEEPAAGDRTTLLQPFT